VGLMGDHRTSYGNAMGLQEWLLAGNWQDVCARDVAHPSPTQPNRQTTHAQKKNAHTTPPPVHCAPAPAQNGPKSPIMGGPFYQGKSHKKFLGQKNAHSSESQGFRRLWQCGGGGLGPPPRVESARGGRGGRGGTRDPKSTTKQKKQVKHFYRQNGWFTRRLIWVGGWEGPAGPPPPVEPTGDSTGEGGPRTQVNCLLSFASKSTSSTSVPQPTNDSTTN